MRGRPWDEFEVGLLICMVRAGLSLNQIAPRLNRSRCSITGKITRDRIRRLATASTVVMFPGSSVPTWPQPSLAALRLAEFDPVVRRALEDRAA